MQQAVGGVPPEARSEIASRLAALPAPVHSAGDPPAIVVQGRPQEGVPGCLACHGEPQRNPQFPSLYGQPPAYLATQLRLFRNDERGGGPYGHVMSRAARGLSDADIDAAAAWFAGQEGARGTAGDAASQGIHATQGKPSQR
jgi:cytochrome c553